MKDRIRKLINSFFQMSDSSLQQLCDLVEEKYIVKGTQFIRKGKLNSCEYFVFEGVGKSYLLNPDNEEVTLGFYTDNTVLSPHTIRTEKGHSIVNFKALTELHIGEMDSGEFEKLMVDNLEIREFGNTVLRAELASKIQKEIALASLPAKERLLLFRQLFPALENLIPHPDIASYLGITPISLSRLRRELTS